MLTKLSPVLGQCFVFDLKISTFGGLSAHVEKVIIMMCVTATLKSKKLRNTFIPSGSPLGLNPFKLESISRQGSDSRSFPQTVAHCFGTGHLRQLQLADSKTCLNTTSEHTFWNPVLMHYQMRLAAVHCHVAYLVCRCST